MSKKVIVIDDSETVRQQVGSVLGEAGFEILEACDGVEGADVIRNHPEASLAICDVNMPNMNGIQMLEVLRTDPSARGLPVIMLTTEGQPELIERAKIAGAKGWVVKPFKANLLLAAVRKLAGTPA